MDLCLTLLATSTLVFRVPSPATLSWQHSVEHIALEETYRATDQGVQLERVRGRGLGAGIDVPPQARLAQGWWSFEPQTPPMREVLLANSADAGGYRLCWASGCRRLQAWARLPDGRLRLQACTQGPTRTPSGR